MRIFARRLYLGVGERYSWKSVRHTRRYTAILALCGCVVYCSTISKNDDMREYQIRFAVNEITYNSYVIPESRVGRKSAIGYMLMGLKGSQAGSII